MENFNSNYQVKMYSQIQLVDCLEEEVFIHGILREKDLLHRDELELDLTPDETFFP